MSVWVVGVWESGIKGSLACESYAKDCFMHCMVTQIKCSSMCSFGHCVRCRIIFSNTARLEEDVVVVVGSQRRRSTRMMCHGKARVVCVLCATLCTSPLFHIETLLGTTSGCNYHHPLHSTRSHAVARQCYWYKVGSSQKQLLAFFPC